MRSPNIDELFESTELLISNAEDTYQKFKNNLAREYQGKIIQFASDPEMIRGLLVHRLSVAGRPSSNLRIGAYQVVSDLRHSLDQAVFAANIYMDQPRQKTNTYFPFSKNPADFDRQFEGRARSSSVHSKLIPLLASLSPWWFDRATQSGDDILRLLGKLAGPNKHQVILDFGPEIIGWSGGYSNPGISIVAYVPPLRADYHNRDNPTLAVKIVKGRTDFIAAITPEEDVPRISGETRICYVATEATNVFMPIEILLAEFLTRTKHCVSKIKKFLMDQ